MRTVLVLGLLIVAATPAAAGPAVERRGFTFGIDEGLHVTTDHEDDGNERRLGGLTLPGLQAGGFVTPRLAIVARFTGLMLTENNSDGGSDSWMFHLLAGPHVQYWPAGRWFVGGGAGVSYYLGPSGFADASPWGYGFDARAGYTLTRTDAGSVTLALEVVPQFYDAHRTTSIAVQLGWQSD